MQYCGHAPVSRFTIAAFTVVPVIAHMPFGHRDGIRDRAGIAAWYRRPAQPSREPMADAGHLRPDAAAAGEDRRAVRIPDGGDAPAWRWIRAGSDFPCKRTEPTFRGDSAWLQT
jgi:hypothetical protein